MLLARLGSFTANRIVNPAAVTLLGSGSRQNLTANGYAIPDGIVGLHVWVEVTVAPGGATLSLSVNGAVGNIPTFVFGATAASDQAITHHVLIRPGAVSTFGASTSHSICAGLPTNFGVSVTTSISLNFTYSIKYQFLKL